MAIKILAGIGTLFIALIAACAINEIILKIKDRFRFRCPKCRKVHKIEDHYCRACGYELGGLSGLFKRREEKGR